MVLDSSSLNKISLLFEGFLAMIVMSYVLDFIIIIRIVPMFVLKDFVRDCFIAQMCAKMCLRAGICAYLRDEAILNKVLGYEHWRYPKEHAHQF